MGLFRRKPPLPAQRRPSLDPDERIIAWSPVDGGDLVATNRGLFVPGQTDRTGWHEISKATWSDATLTLVVADVVGGRDGYVVVADRAPAVYSLADPGDLPHEVRARVTRSVAYAVHHATPGVWVVARRVSGVDGLSWMVRYDRGVDAGDPAVATLTDQLVATARSTG